MNKKRDTKIETELEDNKLDMAKQLELRTLTLFQFINTLGHYTDHAWFLDLNERYLIRFYRVFEYPTSFRIDQLIADDPLPNWQDHHSFSPITNSR